MNLQKMKPLLIEYFSGKIEAHCKYLKKLKAGAELLKMMQMNTHINLTYLGAKAVKYGANVALNLKKYHGVLWLCSGRHTLADNVLQPYAVGAFKHCTNLKAQNYE